MPLLTGKTGDFATRHGYILEVQVEAAQVESTGNRSGYGSGSGSGSGSAGMGSGTGHDSGMGSGNDSAASNSYEGQAIRIWEMKRSSFRVMLRMSDEVK